METPTRAPAKGRGGRGPKRGNRESMYKTVLDIRRGNRDNLLIFQLKHML